MKKSLHMMLQNRYYKVIFNSNLVSIQYIMSIHIYVYHYNIHIHI